MWKQHNENPVNARVGDCVVRAISTGKHALTVIDGDYYDVWQSGQEIPIYYFMKDEE